MTDGETIRMLLEADKAGEDVRAPLSDLLEENGLPEMAKHFRYAHRPGGNCTIYSALANSDDITWKYPKTCLQELVMLKSLIGQSEVAHA